MKGRSDGGSTVIVVLIVTLLIAAVSGGLVMMSGVERAIAGNFQAAHQGRLAAEAALERAVVDVRRFPPTDLLNGAAISSFRDVGTTVTASWGATLDLVSLTTSVQAQSDAMLAWSSDRPSWRLLSYGMLSSLIQTASGGSEWYLVCWIGDDPADADGNPFQDTNGVVLLRAAALGPFGRRHDVRAAVSVAQGLQILSWRSVQ